MATSSANNAAIFSSRGRSHASRFLARLSASTAFLLIIENVKDSLWSSKAPYWSLDPSGFLPTFGLRRCPIHAEALGQNFEQKGVVLASSARMRFSQE
jgi:hypothetical protein